MSFKDDITVFNIIGLIDMKRMNLSAAKVYSRFMGFIAGMQEKAAQNAINNLQQSLESCM